MLLASGPHPLQLHSPHHHPKLFGIWPHNIHPRRLQQWIHMYVCACAARDTEIDWLVCFLGSHVGLQLPEWLT